MAARQGATPPRWLGRSRLSLLAGARGSGKRSLAQRSVATASRESPVAYVDIAGRLDPQFLHHHDADLDRLLIVRPASMRDAMASVRVVRGETRPG